MEYVQTVMGTGFASGTLPSTPYIVSLAYAPRPCTVTLVSVAGGRLIELSSDGGINFYSPTVSATTTAMINVAVLAPVTHARFTGTIGDRWSIC